MVALHEEGPPTEQKIFLDGDLEKPRDYRNRKLSTESESPDSLKYAGGCEAKGGQKAQIWHSNN